MAKSALRQYDAVFIYPPAEETLGTVKNLVSDEFKGSSVKILKEEDMGVKSLAYEIKKNDRGHYICYNIEAEPDTIKSLEKSLKLKPDILKFVFFRNQQKT
jgi:small subunit ribosomal protein S6